MVFCFKQQVAFISDNGRPSDMECGSLPFHLYSSINHSNSYSSNSQFFIIKTFRISSPPKSRNKYSGFSCNSLPLRTNNRHAIYKDIQRFAKQNKLKEALTILDYLDQRGIPVNPITFSSLLEACIRSKSLIEGKQIHTHIRINGLESNDVLRTKLVDLYTRCGSIQDAQKVFDESTSNSVDPWNALLRGIMTSGNKKFRDFLSTYSEMRDLGIELDVYSFSAVIKGFASASALKHGLKVHALLVKNGLIDSSMLKTGLIDLYCKCGKLKLANLVFDEIRERDLIVWGALIGGFAHNKLHKEALDCVRWMISEERLYPNSAILTTILPVIGEVCKQKLAKEVHAYVLKNKSYSKQLVIQSALINMYCKCRDINAGRRVFYQSRKRNVISWTALMSGYASNGMLEQALRSVIWMQQEGFRPDVVTTATVLPVCAQLKALNNGKEIHAYAVKNCFLPNVSVVTSLMVMYSKCGKLDYSFKLFESLEGKNVIAWTAMIDSYVENGHLDEALRVFRTMQLSSQRPDAVAMARILTVCGELKAPKLGKEIHGRILKSSFVTIPFVSAEIIKMYGRCGLIDCAKSVFDAVPVKGSMTRTSIIAAYGHNGMFQEAISLFEKMRSDGFIPTEFTFKVVLSICCEAGLVDKGCQIFSLMTETYKLKPSEEHYSIITQLLTRFGRIKDAKRFMEMTSLSS